MPEPLKNRYNDQLITDLAKDIKLEYPPFDSEKFRQNIFNKDWHNRELKDRMAHVAVTLNDFLPKDYKKALKILKSVSTRFNGFEYMFFPGYVELYGLEDYEESVSALEHFTEFASAEFAVRPFIKKYPSKMMKQMEQWALSENYHVRRLASEGCRPRLPWAMALPLFKKDPAPVVNILKRLKADESEYVRRSVANNLNDISKDNPTLLIDIAEQWMGESTETDKLIKHACRSLLKQGEPTVLKLFGFFEPAHVMIEKFKIQKSVIMGEEVEFSFDLSTEQAELGKLRIEYAIGFMKSNGKQSRKVFKIAESTYSDNKKVVTKKHSFKAISTRRYYSGNHTLAIILNGQEREFGEFLLKD